MDSYTIIENVTYGNHKRQQLDLYLPENVKSKSGIIIYIHGGGWHSGDKSVHNPDCIHFCKLGYICASLNYRFVTEEISVFDELDDISFALETIKFECSKRGYSVDKAILSGGSAGGHLSLLFAYSRKNNVAITPVAVCAYCPPVDCSKSDFLLGISGEFEDWKYDILSKCCGVKISKDSHLNTKQQEALKSISPVRFLSSACVPTAVFHGINDELVPFEHTLDFLKRLNEIGIKNDLIIYKNSGHALDKDPECSDKSKDIIKKYAETYL